MRHLNRCAGLLTVTTVCLYLAGCSDHQSQRTATTPVIKGVALETVKATAIPETLEVVGTVRARTTAAVAARIPGSITVLHAREGDRVRKGQLLAQLESGEHTAQASGAVALLDDARRGVDEARARQKLADSTFERFKKLYEEQALTRQEFDQKQTERELAHQAVARAEARLRQAQEGSKAAGTVADYTKIVAPISGVITARQAELGATVFPAQPLFTIEDEGSYQLELAVPESLSGKLRPGMPVRITLDALQATFSTKVHEIVPAADPASRTFTAKVLLTQKGLKSGMFGRASLALGSTINGILVPKSAIFERGALTAVWTVGADNLTRMRLVKLGKSSAERVEILSGLTEGDRIVGIASEKITDGAKLEP